MMYEEYAEDIAGVTTSKHVRFSGDTKISPPHEHAPEEPIVADTTNVVTAAAIPAPTPMSAYNVLCFFFAAQVLMYATSTIDMGVLILVCVVGPKSPLAIGVLGLSVCYMGMVSSLFIIGVFAAMRPVGDNRLLVTVPELYHRDLLAAKVLACIGVLGGLGSAAVVCTITLFM